MVAAARPFLNRPALPDALTPNLLTPISYLLSLWQQKSPPPHFLWDERPAFRGTTRIRILRYALSSGNGGTPVPLSGAAPGRTKRHSLRRLSAGGRPSLQSANPLFSHSTHLHCPYLYHSFPQNASRKVCFKSYCNNRKITIDKTALLW